MLRIIKYAMLIAFSLPFAYSLECYACLEQDRNDGKCGQNVELCKQNENVCLATVKWGSAPYFTEGAPKQYFISKQCSTKEFCDQRKKETFPKCDRVSYNDWECAECCQGDRCNFYVTLGSAYTKSSWLVICFAISLWILQYRNSFQF